VISCYTCDSATDPTCGFTQEDLDKTELCYALLGRENFCFAHSNGSRYVRGCLNDFPDYKSTCRENNENCQICDDFDCNSMKTIEETCVTCDSTIDDNCKNLLAIQTPTLCGEGSIDKSGCYLYDKGNCVASGFEMSIQ
jgi:hypothetical protein